MSTTSPYSIRFTPEQRAFIRAHASALKLADSQWICQRLFAQAELYLPNQKILLPPDDDKHLAKILYLLGQSRMASNLNQIAKAVNMGTLILSPDVYAQIDESHHNIRWMRSELIKGLGLRGQKRQERRS